MADNAGSEAQPPEFSAQLSMHLPQLHRTRGRAMPVPGMAADADKWLLQLLALEQHELDSGHVSTLC